MSSAICCTLDQSKILTSGNSLTPFFSSGSLPAQSSPGPKYYWTPTEMSPVAPGGLIINPQTGKQSVQCFDDP